MGYYSFYRIIKDILYNFKKNKLLVIVAIIILLIFLSNKVFATSTIPLITFRGISYNLTIDTSNNVCKLNNTNISNDIWNYENFAFFNFGDDSLPYLYIYVWNGDLKIGKGVAPRFSKL